MALFRSSSPNIDDLLQPIGERFARLEKRLGELEGGAQRHAAHISHTTSRIDELAPDLETVRHEVRALSDAVTSRLASIEQSTAVAPLEARLTQLAELVAQIAALVEDLKQRVDAVPGRTAAAAAGAGTSATDFTGEPVLEVDGGLKVLHRPGTGPTVVAFVAPAMPMPRNPRRMAEFLAQTEATALVLAATGPAGFEAASIRSAIAMLTERGLLPRDGGDVVACGVGAGAQAACVHAAAIGAGAVIAFNPVDLATPLDAARPYVFADPLSRELRIPTDGQADVAAARIVAVPFAGSNIIDFVTETGVAKTLLDLVTSDAAAGSVRQILRAARARSATYWRGMATQLRSKAPRWSAARQTALERSYNLQPTDVETMMTLADSLLESGRRPEAGPLLDALWERAGEIPMLPALWRLYMAAGQYGRARDVGWQAVQERPQDPILRVNLARSLIRLSQPEAAAAQLDVAKENAGSNRQALVQIRQVNERLGRVPPQSGGGQPGARPAR
jgi:hypothetical protein